MDERERSKSLASHKTEVGILVRQNTLRQISLKVENTNAQNKPVIKYLGMKIGRNMSLKEHIDDSVEKLVKYLRALGGIFRRRGGIYRSILTK